MCEAGQEAGPRGYQHALPLMLGTEAERATLWAPSCQQRCVLNPKSPVPRIPSPHGQTFL